MQEQWRNIEGYENLYQVSNFGRVKSLDRALKSTHKNSNLFRKGRILKPGYDRKGYSFVVLSKESKKKVVKVHRLVAKAFILNPLNLPFVNHKDENPRNNKAYNLEWCTNKYNLNYGSLPLKRKNNLNQCAISVIMCDINGTEIKTFSSVTEAAKEVSGINAVSAISKCCKCKRNTAYGYVWKYKNNNQ